MKYSSFASTVLAAFAVLAGLPAQALAQTIPLGTASSFALLAGSGITIAGAVNSSTITGDIGSFPTATITGAGNAVIVGTNHGGDSVTQTAKTDLGTAYDTAVARAATTVATELGASTKTAGTYDSASGTFGLTGILTLDGGGDPNAVFIFKTTSTLITAASSQVVLTNSAQAANVFWQVGSSATLGSSSIFRGNILALTAISVGTSATVQGRLLARNAAVTLDGSNTISLPLAAQTITFAPISTHTACDAAFTFVLPTSSSGLAVTLAATGPATISGNTVTLTGGTGTVVITASQAGNGSFSPATNVTQSFSVTSCALVPQTIAFLPIPNHSACDAPFIFVLPVATSGLPVTLAVTGPATVSGNTVTLTGAVGTVVLTASQAGNGVFSAAPNVTQSFTVTACALVPQTIAFLPIPNHTACDGPFTFVFPVATSGLPVTLAVTGPATVSGNTVTLTGAVGTVVLTASQAGNGVFSAAPNVTQSFTVAACALVPQAITFAPLFTHTACDAPFTFVYPLASSGLAVTLAVTGPATVSGNTVTLTGALGTVVITATQAGNGVFSAAPDVTQSFTVTACALTAQTITFAPIGAHIACDAPFAFTLPTASSGLPVSLAVTGPATVVGNTVTLTGAVGTVVLIASQSGNGTFSAAANVAQSFVVSACAPAPTAQTIAFAAIPGHTACDAPFTFIFPAASSGLPVTLAVSGPATVSGNTVTLTGAVGTVTLTATQAGDSTFAPASTVTQTFAITACALTAQTITFAPIPAHTGCDAPFTFTAPTSSSGLPVTLAVSGPATLSGNTVSLNGTAGTVVIIATQAGNGTFAPAPNVTQSFAVTACAPGAQTITFLPILGHTACDAPFTFVAPVASSGLPVTLTVSGPATLSGNTVTLTGVVGTVVITATQAGNATFAPASSVTQTIAVGACGTLPVITSPFDVQEGGQPVAPNFQLGVVGTPFPGYQITATGSPTSFGAINLPPGLSVNTLTGAITGTPTVVDTWFVTIQARNASGVAEELVIFVISGVGTVVAPVVTSVNTAAGTAGSPFVTFTPTATGSPTSFAATGLPPGLSINPQTGAISGVPTVGGTYAVTLRATNAVGTTTSGLTIAIASGPSSRIVNFSTRALSGTGEQSLVMGFVVAGDGKNLLVRAIGPTLGSLGVVNALADPFLTLFPPTGPSATNDNWQITSNGQDQGALVAATAARVGAFALPNGSKDSTLMATVNNGAHTLSLLRPNGTTGVALTEIYDTDLNPSARLINVSARMNVTTGEGIVIAGLVIVGNGPKTVLIRGVGPTLSAFGVSGVLADPTIAVFAGSSQIGSNDNWGTGSSTAAQISGAAAQVGAFALTTGSRDAALLLTLQPGAYSVQLSGVGNTTGVALIEVYDTH